MESLKDPSSFRHFIHEHPLECSDQMPLSQDVCCFCCGLRVSAENGGCCSCKACEIYLHGICSRFPPTVRHDSHPDHSLALVSVSHGVGRASGVCQACENLITGFYYRCAVCEVSYHPLCLSLPQSISINCHPHSLQLECSAYEFRCDMCNKPSYRGWLYRCGLCEFDIHLGCAFSRITKLETSNFSIGNIPCDETTGRELMRLLVDKFVNMEKASGRSPAGGWLEIAKSPGGRNFMKGVRIVSPASFEQSQFPDDKSVLLDVSMTPSYQFSETYFSIDLAKSYSTGDENKTNNNNSEKSPLGLRLGVQESKDKIGLVNTVTPSVVMGLSDWDKKQPRGVGAVGNVNHARTKKEPSGKKSDRRDNVVNGEGNKVAHSDIVSTVPLFQISSKIQ
ncbi:hypothetical protein MLD38_035627 [Melastoma candidum]|uniref:Uncharacterized protein n=1 Tax=Melastoma candidum TaxID=119954 RepID=A0ACB9LGN7_9MYRT|nr:hypothetical protein MLD38_035627 [Melastoma candidum]